MVIGWGLGVDSTAMLLYLINNPQARDWKLEELAVVTAMVGDEWDQTGVDATEVVLPILREHRIRLIQVGRTRRRVSRSGLGVVVFDDSRCPSVLHMDGDYRLSDELLAAGTIPQTGGARLCSVHAKGDCLDPVIAAITQGRPYRHQLGFEVTEQARALKDSRYNTATRTGEYPLIAWEWTRAAASDYLLKIVGRQWHKSACVYCPYALSSVAGRRDTLARYGAHPAAGARTLWLEHVALALNPRQGLIAGRRAIDLVTDLGMTEVLAHFHTALETAMYAVYEVRRVTIPAKKPGAKSQRWRSIRILAQGSRAAMLARLVHQPGRAVVGEDGILRKMIRDGTDPADAYAEHFWVAAPAGVDAKARPGFERWWLRATSGRIARAG
ncbi:hypothetical protein IU452_33845 [Nocardia transvalensis]|nr:hypothetical protein [Nocardia transvalensis]